MFVVHFNLEKNLSTPIQRNVVTNNGGRVQFKGVIV